MRFFLEVVGVLAVFGAFVFVLAWLQVRLDRALAARSRGRRGG